MGVRKLKNTWWADFTFNYVRYRKRSPENSRAGALAYETVLKQRLARGEPIERGPKEQGVTFENFAWQWFDEYVEANNKPREQRAKKYILSGSLIPFFGPTLVHQINSRDIERYKAYELGQGTSNKTIKNRLTVFNKCLVTAYEWLDLAGTPPKIRWPRCVSIRTDYLSADECNVLLSQADGIMAEMILMSLRTGMRQGEIKGLQWNSIDWQTRSVAIRHSLCDYTKSLGTPKSGHERHIPLDVDVYEILYRRRKATGFVFTDGDGSPFNGSRLNRALENICKRAGLRRITWHILRHTFASQLAMTGVPLHVVQVLLGHTSVTTTMRYAHVAPSALRPAIELLNPRSVLSEKFGHPAVNRWTEKQFKDAA